MMTQRNFLILACGTIAIGCMRQSPPTDLMAKAEVSVREVEQTETAQAAPLEVRTAREKLDQAKEAMGGKKYGTAKMMAEQAIVDAEAAKTKTQADKTQRTNDEVKKSMETLRRETQRPGVPSDAAPVRRPH